MANKQIGYRVPEEVLKNFTEACKNEDKDPQAVLKRFMEEYANENNRGVDNMTLVTFENNYKFILKEGSIKVETLKHFGKLINSEFVNFNEIETKSALNFEHYENVQIIKPVHFYDAYNKLKQNNGMSFGSFGT